MRKIAVCALLLMACGMVADAEVVRWLPVAASNPGKFSGDWATDVWIFSKVADAPLEVRVAFLPTVEGTADPAEVTIEVPAKDPLEIQDVVGTLFGESRPGALRFRAEQPFEVQSRTFNSGGATGTYGQGVQAVRPDSVTPGWVLLGAANVPGTDGTRSNLGLVNMSDQTVEGWIFVEANPGNIGLGQAKFELGPHGWMQADVFALVGFEAEEVEQATVFGLFPQGTVLAYLSRVDNRSGDGFFALPFDAAVVYTLPAEWTVSLILDYSDGVDVAQLVYTGEDGNDVVVESPADLFSVEGLIFTSPAEFCYSVDATPGENGGSVKVTVDYQRSGEPPQQHVTSMEAVGPGEPVPFEDFADCFDLY